MIWMAIFPLTVMRPFNLAMQRYVGDVGDRFNPAQRFRGMLGGGQGTGMLTSDSWEVEAVV